MAIPILMAPITITANNKWLDYKIAAGAEVSISIATGVYTDFRAVWTAVAAALGANFSLSFITTGVAGRTGIYYSGGGGNLTLMWATGTHTGSNIGAVIGFDTAADDSGAIYHASDYQAQGMWVSTRHPARDTGHWAPQMVAGKMWRSLSGAKCKQIILDSRRTREVEFEEIPPEIVWLDQATGANTNRDFESFLTAHKAEQLAYYPDQDSATHVHCYMQEPSDMPANFARPHVDIETWNFKLILLRAE